jgi:voltage-gated potassium channel
VRQRFRRAATFVFAVTVMGTIGYHLIEGADWFDSFYMTVVTITTVGFLEVFPLSMLGRLWTVVLIVLGLGSVFYTASVGLELIVQSTSISGRRRRLQRDIDRLSNHHILCGFGRVGESIWHDLVLGGEDVVVVENNEDRFALAESLGALVILGDATTNTILDQAGGLGPGERPQRCR